MFSVTFLFVSRHAATSGLQRMAARLASLHTSADGCWSSSNFYSSPVAFISHVHTMVLAMQAAARVLKVCYLLVAAAEQHAGWLLCAGCAFSACYTSGNTQYPGCCAFSLLVCNTQCSSVCSAFSLLHIRLHTVNPIAAPAGALELPICGVIQTVHACHEPC